MDKSLFAVTAMCSLRRSFEMRAFSNGVEIDIDDTNTVILILKSTIIKPAAMASSHCGFWIQEAIRVLYILHAIIHKNPVCASSFYQSANSIIRHSIMFMR